MWFGKSGTPYWSAAEDELSTALPPTMTKLVYCLLMQNEIDCAMLEQCMASSYSNVHVHGGL